MKLTHFKLLNVLKKNKIKKKSIDSYKMNWLLTLIVVAVVVYMFSGGKKTKSGSLSMKLPKVVSDNKLVFGLVAGFLVCWLMGSDLVEGLRMDPNHPSFDGLQSCCEDEANCNTDALRRISDPRGLGLNVAKDAYCAADETTRRSHRERCADFMNSTDGNLEEGGGTGVERDICRALLMVSGIETEADTRPEPGSGLFGGNYSGKEWTERCCFRRADGVGAYGQALHNNGPYPRFEMGYHDVEQPEDEKIKCFGKSAVPGEDGEPQVQEYSEVTRHFDYRPPEQCR